MVWLGDFNYRITATNSNIVHLLIQNDMWEVLRSNDQLEIEKKLKRVGFGYSEGEILFAPTFKFKTGSDTYSQKRNSSWTDRILFRSNDALLKLANYDSNNLLKISDHRPVFAQFLLKFDDQSAENRSRIESLKFEAVRRSSERR